MIKKAIFSGAIILSVLFSACGTEQKGITANVDPYIGTGGHGHTFLGVTQPFGAVQIGLNNIDKGWDWCSGYHYSDSIAMGFTHLHLNGTGCSDSGDLLFMPYTGAEKVKRGSQDNPTEGYSSRYSHATEVVSPSYYSVMLEDYNVKVELTASKRVAFHRYTYLDKEGAKYVMVDLRTANGHDGSYEAFLEQVDEKTIRGYRYSNGWTKDQRIFFTAVFSEPVTLKLYSEEQPVDGKSLKGSNVKGNMFLSDDVKELKVKVGISPVSMENAQKNIEAEIKNWNFEKVQAQTELEWNNELSRIKADISDPDANKIFHTALYHAFIQPNTFNDVNGDYRGSDKEVYTNAPFTNYTVFSLWDTYRAAHPLYTIVQPERVPDFINSMLAIYDQKGLLPVWHLYGGDTYEMIGIQSVPVIADAILKGFEGFDYEKAFEAMKASMLSDYKSLKHVRENGYIPSDLEGESVAKGLEYAIADWGVAQVAKKLGKDEDYKLFSERAKNYSHYWDGETTFFRGKQQDGTWSTPFDPYHSTHRQDAYCEGNALQYNWLVSHDVEGLISLFGSEEAFISKLDTLFTLEEELGEGASPDISGFIGQYAHGNEPGHQTIYMYAFVGQQWKAAEKARYIMKHLYRNDFNGLEGNEDCGQMSSWYVLSALGFYPVNPSNGVYVFGSPVVDKAEIALPDNKKFTIVAENNSDENIYIQSVTLNGQPYSNSYILHKDIIAGGELKFVMGAQPNYDFGAAKESRPQSKVY